MLDTKTLIEKFNNYFPVGATVRWRSVNHPNYSHKEYTVKTRAYDHFGQPVTFLEGHRGFVSIEPGFVDYEYLENLDWTIPKAHLDQTIETYESFLDTPGVNTQIALEHVLRPLAARYENGERSEELYDAMMNVE